MDPRIPGQPAESLAAQHRRAETASEHPGFLRGRRNGQPEGATAGDIAGAAGRSVDEDRPRAITESERLLYELRRRGQQCEDQLDRYKRIEALLTKYPEATEVFELWQLLLGEGLSHMGMGVSAGKSARL